MPNPDLRAPWSNLRRSRYCGERVPPSRGVARGSAKLIRSRREMRMRRHVATFVAAALMLTLAAPVAAVGAILLFTTASSIVVIVGAAVLGALFLGRGRPTSPEGAAE